MLSVFFFIRKEKNMSTLTEQKELTEKLVCASKAYYNGLPSIMSDIEFDKFVEKLADMEKESGIIFSGSPTVSVGAAVVTALESSRHEQPALSLDKCKYKDKENLIEWLDDKEGCLSWKMDGLTIVATYDGGKLTKAVTRGNGEIGSVVTHNAMFFEGLPHEIPYKNHLVVRGEAIMTRTEFNRVNDSAGGIYENERNLASATIQMLDANESKKRKICFFAFELVSPKPKDDLSFYSDRMDFLSNNGFDTVVFTHVNQQNLLEEIESFKKKLSNLDIPTDGLVLTYEDQAYGESLGMTGHHKRSSVALKWPDETKTTILRNIEWSVGKTGIVTPVAVFDPVRLGAGSTVTRASLHNISILRNLPFKGNNDRNSSVALGDQIQVYLANMIIPQIASYSHNGDYTLEHPRTSIEIPKICPVCHKLLRQENSNGVWTLHCDNEDCSARRIGGLLRTFGRDGLYVIGLGEAQLKDLISLDIVDYHPYSFFHFVSQYHNLMNGMKNLDPGFNEKIETLMQMDGWGKKSIENLVAAIDKSRVTNLSKFLYSLNIPMVGHDLSKKISSYCNDDIEQFVSLFLSFDMAEDLLRANLISLEGIGTEKAESVLLWRKKVLLDTAERQYLLKLISCLEIGSSVKNSDSLQGLTFCITGSVNVYKNRKEFKESVESRGGKVTGTVTKNTDYLVINDLTSTTGKAKMARELNCPMISEQQFIDRFGK